MIADLVEGRRAFEGRAWATAYSALDRADAVQGLDPLDLERLGLAAFLTGREAESDAARERAHRGHLESGDAEGAARVGFWLALALTLRGEPARGAGWFARAGRVLAFFTNRSRGLSAEEFPELTGREREVLDLLVEGQSNAGIAARLGLTSKTTSNYVSSILTKLQVPDRYAAARKARGQPG